MPAHDLKGLKQTSSLITISFTTSETAPNTFLQGQVDLQLNPLDNEVFVVQAIDMDPSPPDNLIGLNTACDSSLSTTSRQTVGSLGDSNVLAVGERIIRSAGAATNGVGFETLSSSSPATVLPYIGIIATNDFFVQLEGRNNANTMTVAGKVYGYRAKADAAVYAALVQSEVLSV